MTLLAASDPTLQPALDPTALEALWELVDDGDLSFLEDLFLSYLVNIEQSIARIDTALDAGEMDPIRHEAHALKGASGNVGAMVMAALCRQLEGSAEAGDTTAIGTDRTSIATEAQRIRLAVARLFPALTVA